MKERITDMKRKVHTTICRIKIEESNTKHQDKKQRRPFLEQKMIPS